MSFTLRQLSTRAIGDSPHLKSWISRIPLGHRSAAVELLSALRFVTRDAYSEWLKQKLLEVCVEPSAVYAVRKFSEPVTGDPITSYWDEEGKPSKRPASSLGSEDLVHSVIASLKKDRTFGALDHPGIEELKAGKVRRVVLIEDSIGSGQRMAEFMRLFMASKTVLSWWSYGWFQFYVIAFVRNRDGEGRICRDLLGSDHPTRKHRKSDKMHFIGEIVYDAQNLSQRWGPNAAQVLSLCDATNLPPFLQRGYGAVMANVIFYHSVPDNTPGLLWSESSQWPSLFPGRMCPDWLVRLLEEKPPPLPAREPGAPKPDLIEILRICKRGVRTLAGIARSMGRDSGTTTALLGEARASGFLTAENRVTKAGMQIIWESKAKERAGPNRSLYIPQQWCVGQRTVQPPRLEADSASSSLFADGEAGQASLERTDARSTTSTLGVAAQQPSRPRVGGDAHGPEGQMP
jgi:hypothetical protein